MVKTHLFVYKIILIGFISSTLFIPLYARTNSLNGKINKEGINIRADSTVFAKSIGVLKKGENVRIIKSRFDWYKIILPSRFTCYTSSAYLKKIGIKTARVKATILNLRFEPSLDSVIIGKVKENTIVHIVREQNGWTEIQGFPYLRGWVNKKFISFMPDRVQKLPPALNNKKENKIAAAKVISHSPNRKETKDYNYFTIEGTIYKLGRIENCPANYKLKNKFATFFLKIPEVYNVNNFLNKKVTVKGMRIYEGCSYIYIDKISLSE